MVATTVREGYGTLPASYPEAGGQIAARRVLQGVAATCLVAALGMVALAAAGGKAASGRTELSIYANKYEDVHAGGNWMQCLQCRHATKMCHPTKAEGRGATPAADNACPPHGGMSSVLVRHNGMMKTKWVDNHVLKAIAEEEAGPEQEAPAPEEEEEEEEEKPFCVRPESGKRAAWDKEHDCVSVAEWLAGMGAYGSEPAEDEDEEGGDDAEEEGGEEEEAGAEEEEEGDPPTAVEKWFNAKVEAEYEHYPEGGDADGDEEGGPQEEEEEESEEAAAKRRPRSSECYGPPNFACQVSCVSECLQAKPMTLSSRSRQQMLMQV